MHRAIAIWEKRSAIKHLFSAAKFDCCTLASGILAAQGFVAMLPRRVFRFCLLGAANCLALARPAMAQSVLCVVKGERNLPVVKMAADSPFVMQKGKPTRMIAHHYALAPAEEFWPLFITVREFSSGA